MTKKYENIKESERRRIERLLDAGLSFRRIAEKLDRSVSSISEEIKRNSTRGKYESGKAGHKAYARRKYSKTQCMKVAKDSELKRYVIDQIKREQSPEGISGRLGNIETDIQYASLKAIYKFVKSVHGRQIEKHLYSKAVKKKGGPKRKKPVSIDGRKMIDKRPKYIEKRKEFGHFEGDFIESGKEGKGSILVLVERKTRYPFLAYTEDKRTEHINNLVAHALERVPVKTVTIDNDLSFQKHEMLSELIKADIFFCHPQCSHEKGTVENRNKALRRYMPRKSDLSGYGNDYIKNVEMKLRNKFMKCLNFLTPQETWDIEMEKLRKKNSFANIKTKNRTNLCVLKINSSVRLQGCV